MKTTTIYNKFGQPFILSSTKLTQEFKNEASQVTGYSRSIYLSSLIDAIKKGDYTYVAGSIKNESGEVENLKKAWGVSYSKGLRRIDIGCQRFVGPNARLLLEAANARYAVVAAAKAARKTKKSVR
jgi:hypothetical protein